MNMKPTAIVAAAFLALAFLSGRANADDDTTPQQLLSVGGSRRLDSGRIADIVGEALWDSRFCTVQGNTIGKMIHLRLDLDQIRKDVGEAIWTRIQPGGDLNSWVEEATGNCRSLGILFGTNGHVSATSNFNTADWLLLDDGGEDQGD
jgi:hypothetical protein